MQSRNVSLGAPSIASGLVQFAEQPFETQPDKFITGTTLDSAGDPLGSCNVYLFLTAGNVYVGKTVSDGSGSYTFYATPGALYYTVAYKVGSPDVMGTTVNTLTGEVEAPVTDSSLLTGLTAYYALEDLTEEVGGLTLTNTNTVTFVSGKVNNGANFVSASTQHLSRADNAAFQFGASTDFSISAWVKFTSVEAGGAYVPIIWYGHPSSAAGYALFVATVGSPGADGHGGLLVSGIAGTREIDTDSSTVNDGAWHLLVGTFDRDGNATLYLDNGTGKTGDMSTVTSVDGSQGLTIGDTSFFNHPYNGMIDEIGIWNRVLTGAEVTALYNGGSGATYPFTGL